MDRFTELLNFFFFNDPATTEIYTLSLHDALPISAAGFTLNVAAVRALAAGADAVILGRGDTKDPAALAASVRTSITAAVAADRLPIARLREAVRRLALLMGAATC